jgi:hypothetical protein
MPVWIWLFWVPQIMQMFLSHVNSFENTLSKTVLEKLSKLYPQAVLYTIKAR